MPPKRQLAHADVDGAVEDLPTVTLRGVEICSTGGPFYGQGSPAEGDHFDRDFIEALAEDTAKVVDEFGEWRSPNKIGHSKEQKLLTDSGLADDEMPGVGWLTNFRTKDGDDGEMKLLADVQRVPAKLAKLLKAGAFRTKSVEISRVKSQTDGKRYTIVSALSWLGGKAPAIRTLDDVIALYSDDGFTPDTIPSTNMRAELRLALSDADLDDVDVDEERELAATVWTADQSYEQLRTEISAAVSALYPSREGGPWAYVRDFASDKALVCVTESGTESHYVVAFERGDDGVTLAPHGEWTEAEQEWVVAMSDVRASLEAELEAVVNMSGPGADTPGRESITTEETQMPKLNSLNDEQIANLATALGVEPGENARDTVAERIASLSAEDNPAPAPVVTETDEGGDGDGGEGGEPETAPTVSLSQADLAELRMKAEQGSAVAEERRIEKRETAISLALSEGRLDPERVETWRGYFDENFDLATKLIAELPVNDDLVRALGADGEGETADDFDRQYAAYAAATGISG